MCACLGSVPTDSNASNCYVAFSVSSLTWGICFQLEANPNKSKDIAFRHAFWHRESTCFPRLHLDVNRMLPKQARSVVPLSRIWHSSAPASWGDFNLREAESEPHVPCCDTTPRFYNRNVLKQEF